MARLENDNFPKLYKWALWKSYFDRGYGFSNYLKVFIYGAAIATLNFKLIFILGVIYAVFCFILGYCLYNYGWVEAETEVNNKFNLFVKQMRHKVIKEKFK